MSRAGLTDNVEHLLEPLPASFRLDQRTAAHLLRRAGFGAPRAERQAAIDRGLAATVDLLVAGHPQPAAELDEIADTAAAAGIDQLAAWWVARMLQGGDPLREKLALFWHGHFATSNDKVADAGFMLGQLRVFLDLGRGRFAPLLLAMARDPAMLVWLDGELNRKGRPNENFARELFELFTLGIGHYGEPDVQEAARAFTGWRRAGGAFQFLPARHDDGDKTVLGVRGRLCADDVLELCLAHPATADHLTRKLVRFFAHPEPPEPIIRALREQFIATGLDVGRLLDRLLRSRWFFAEDVIGSRILSPAELVIGTLRTLEARSDATAVARAIAGLGQALLRPPSVKGWDGEQAWIHAAAMVARMNCGAAIAAGADRLVLDGDPTHALGSPPSDVPEIVRQYAAALGLAPLAPDVAATIAAQVADLTPPQRPASVLGALLGLPEASIG